MANDARDHAERIVQRMDKAAAALDKLSQQGDRKERETRTPRTVEERKALIQQDKASVAASKSPVGTEHAVAALRAADAAQSLYKLAKHGSVTGGIADLAGYGLNKVGLKGAGGVARDVGSAMAIAETAGGNWMAAPRALEGAGGLAKRAVTSPLGPIGGSMLAYKAARAGISTVDKYTRPTDVPFSQSVSSAVTANSGEESLLHTVRAGGKATETAGKVGGAGVGAVLGGMTGLGPLGALAGGYDGS